MNRKNTTKKRSNGFTLVEVMIAIGIFSLVIAGTLSVYLMCHRIWQSTSLKMQTTRNINMAISRLTYGPGPYNGLRSAATIDIQPGSGGSWRLAFSNSFDGLRWIDYNSANSNIVLFPDTGNTSNWELICNNVDSASAASTDEGVSIALTIKQRDGRITSTNYASVFIKKRNK